MRYGAPRPPDLLEGRHLVVLEDTELAWVGAGDHRAGLVPGAADVAVGDLLGEAVDRGRVAGVAVQG